MLIIEHLIRGDRMNTLLRADIIHKAGILRKSCPELRKGQAIQTIAVEIDHNKLGTLLESNCDCFYDDSKIDMFLDKFCEE
jgi:hypothetical protein